MYEPAQAGPRLQNVVVWGGGGLCVIDFGRAEMDPSEQRCQQELVQVEDMWRRAVVTLTG